MNIAAEAIRIRLQMHQQNLARGEAQLKQIDQARAVTEKLMEDDRAAVEYYQQQLSASMPAMTAPTMPVPAYAPPPGYQLVPVQPPPGYQVQPIPQTQQQPDQAAVQQRVAAAAEAVTHMRLPYSVPAGHGETGSGLGSFIPEHSVPTNGFGSATEDI